MASMFALIACATLSAQSVIWKDDFDGDISKKVKHKVEDNYLIFDNAPLMLFKEPYYLRSLNFRNVTFDFINSYITVGGKGENEAANALVGKSVFFNILYENN